MRPELPRPGEVDRPSATARERLDRALRREVAELRVRMSEASLRSDVFLEMGAPEAAAKVVAEQRELLDDFHERLDTAVAQAAVEREAERVVATELARQRGGRGPAERSPAPVAAVLMATAVAILAMVVSGGPVAAELLGAVPDTDDPTGGADLWAPGSSAGEASATSASAAPATRPPDDPYLPGLAGDASAPRLPDDPASVFGLLDRLLAASQHPLDGVSPVLSGSVEEVAPEPLAEALPRDAEPEPQPSSEEAPPAPTAAEGNEPAPGGARQQDADGGEEGEDRETASEPDASPSGEDPLLGANQEGSAGDVGEFDPASDDLR